MTESLIHNMMSQATRAAGNAGIGKGELYSQGNSKYAYRSIDSTLATFNRIFASLGMSVSSKAENPTHEFVVREGKYGKDHWCQIAFTLVMSFRASDGSFVQSSLFGVHASKEPAKLAGQLQSYLTKEILFKTFMVPTQGLEDIDGMDFELPSSQEAVDEAAASIAKTFSGAVAKPAEVTAKELITFANQNGLIEQAKAWLKTEAGGRGSEDLTAQERADMKSHLERCLQVKEA